MKLLITLERDETGMIIAECPTLPGCVSQGSTEAAAIENVRETIKGCLSARRANSLSLYLEETHYRAARASERSLTKDD